MEWSTEEAKERLELTLTKYGSWQRIPHLDLYNLLEGNRAFLTKQHEQDVEKFNRLQKEIADLNKKGISTQPYHKFGKKDFWHPSSPGFGAEVRRRCEQDLEWLAGYMTWETNPEGQGKPIKENLITRENVGPLLDLFVKKDKTKSVGEQSKTKNRMVLWPRGGMKTSCDIADIVQWILNFPDIRILVLTAAEDLSVAILDEMKGHFIIRQNEPTLMNMFFPEFCIEDKDSGAEGEFSCPVWLAKQVRRKEPTVMSSSITATIAGFHFEVIKADDTVETRNSSTDEQCKKVSSNFAVIKKTLRYFGYTDKVGTRYHEEDMYGQDLLQNVGERVITKGQGWELVENKSTDSLFLVGRAIQIKAGVKEELEKKQLKPNYLNAGADGCDLLMPNVLPFSRLMSMLAEDDEIVFEAQMNQNCRPTSVIVFDRPLLEKNTVTFQDVPQFGPVAHFWDLAYKDGTGRDYTTAVSARWGSDGVCYIHAMVRDRFATDTDLAKAIVQFTKAHKPQVVGIEDSPGANWIMSALDLECSRERDVQVRQTLSRNAINWAKIDKQKGAKKSRLGSLQPLLVGGLLKFANYLDYLDALYEEFERCMTRSRHDDIPDAIAYVTQYRHQFSYYFQSTQATAPVPMSKEDRDRMDSQAWHNLIFEENTDAFGRPGYAIPPPVSEPVTELEMGTGPNPYGLDNMLGAGLD